MSFVPIYMLHTFTMVYLLVNADSTMNMVTANNSSSSVQTIFNASSTFKGGKQTELLVVVMVVIIFACFLLPTAYIICRKQKSNKLKQTENSFSKSRTSSTMSDVILGPKKIEYKASMKEIKDLKSTKSNTSMTSNTSTESLESFQDTRFLRKPKGLREHLSFSRKEDTEIVTIDSATDASSKSSEVVPELQLTPKSSVLKDSTGIKSKISPILPKPTGKPTKGAMKLSTYSKSVVQVKGSHAGVRYVVASKLRSKAESQKRVGATNSKSTAKPKQSFGSETESALSVDGTSLYSDASLSTSEID